MTDIAVDSPDSDHRSGTAWVLTIGGTLGLVAAFVLTTDKIGLLKSTIDGTQKTLSCDINAFVSCSAVMDSSQSEAFGFANSILGIIGFTVVLLLGVLLLARVTLPSFVWLGLQAGALFGICFVTWLQFQSIGVIGKLCPYCMLVWAVMIPIFVVVTAANLVRFAPGSLVARFVDDWKLLIISLWYVVVLAAIWFEFGSTLWA